jgi:hypothetical protein
VSVLVFLLVLVVQGVVNFFANKSLKDSSAG